jgi:phage baseplate assembly protein W
MQLASDNAVTGDDRAAVKALAFVAGSVPLDATGDYATVTGEAALWQEIMICLSVSPGEYKLRPAFGIGARDFVKKPATLANRDELRRRIFDQLSHMRRIEKVESVDVVRQVLDGKTIDRVSIVARAFGRVITFRPFNLRERS